MTRPVLIIFLKAPRPGMVKSRLARDIGQLPALLFYRRSSSALTRRLARDRRWDTWLYVAPDEAAWRGRYWPAKIRRRPQGHGDLGERMARALADFRGPAVLIGSDLPDLTRAQIAGAFRALGRADVVFGPAQDGGYWLVGKRGPIAMGPVFAGVRWSTEHTLADTLANLPGHRRVALLETLEDVDDAGSFRRWQVRAGGRAR